MNTPDRPPIFFHQPRLKNKRQSSSRRDSKSTRALFSQKIDRMVYINAVELIYTRTLELPPVCPKKRTKTRLYRLNRIALSSADRDSAAERDPFPQTYYNARECH